MKPLLLLLSILPLSFSSCKKNNEGPIDGFTLSKSYIQVYIDVDKIICQNTVAGNYIHVMVEGNNIKYSEPATGRYKELSERFGDTDYNKELVPYSNYAIADEFTLIDIKSDKDFDANHSAGESLSDVITIIGASPYLYINSDYTETYDWRNAPDDYKINSITYSPGYSPVNKHLKNLTSADLLLLARDIYFKFTSEPTLEKNHTLTVFFISNDKEITSTLDMSFEY